VLRADPIDAVKSLARTETRVAAIVTDGDAGHPLAFTNLFERIS
jgi:hypothetical protein